MLRLPVYNQEGKEIKSMDLDPKVFDEKINSAALCQAVNTYLANKRKGTASTKTRAEVSGGGRKPWRQKGTGRARVGSIRSPLWRHGGVIFGPHPRNFHKKLPKKIKVLALKSSIITKLKENDLVILEDIKLEKPKTRQIKKILDNLKIKEKSLLLVDRIESNLRFGCKNFPILSLMRAEDANVYDVLRFKKLIITVPALGRIIKRLTLLKR